MHMDMHISDMYMNGVHGVDWDEQQQQQQQQWQLPGLAAGMGQALLPAAGGSGRQRMSRRPSEPCYEAFMGDASPGCAYAPTEHASDSERQQLQQQNGKQDWTGLQEGDTPSGGVSPSAAAAATPAKPELDEQQMRQLSPLQQLLRGGRPAWPLMPSADTVLELLRTKGPEALVVYLDEGSFADYLQEWKVGWYRALLTVFFERGWGAAAGCVHFSAVRSNGRCRKHTNQQSSAARLTMLCCAVLCCAVLCCAVL
jgi:hypothetical protein